MEGNVQKMREALQEFVDCWDNCNYAEMGKQLVEQARAALAEPPRNCDVGNAEEQDERFVTWRYSKLLRAELGLDALAWAQMPYEEGGAE